MALTGVSSKGENNTGISSSLSNYSNKWVLTISLFNLLVTCILSGVVLSSFLKDKNRTSIEDLVAHLENPQSPAVRVDGVSRESAIDSSTSESKTMNATESAQKSHSDKPRFGKMISLDQFTINLATVGGVNPKFVRVDVSLEVPSEDAESEVNAKIPQVRNVIIDLFNGKRSNDLSTVEGREVLKEDIKNALNNFMMNGKITGVFFTSFAISS